MRTARTLEEAIRDANESWLIEFYAPSENAMLAIRRTLSAVNKLSRQKLKENAPDLSERGIVDDYNRHPRKVKGFFQLLGESATPEILLMAWRVMQGMEIKQVAINYSRQKVFEMEIVLQSPYGDSNESYQSSKIQDFSVFRHIGIMTIGNSPVFDGFYALKIR